MPHFRLKNFGKTPAIIEAWAIGGGTVDDIGKDMPAIIVPEGGETPPGTTIGVGEQTTTFSVEIKLLPATLDEIRAGKKAVICAFWMRYRTVFDDVCVTGLGFTSDKNNRLVLSTRTDLTYFT
jgi:hypothetical protein